MTDNELLTLYENSELAIHQKAAIYRRSNHYPKTLEDVLENLELVCPVSVPNRQQKIERAAANIMLSIMEAREQAKANARA